MDNSLRADMRGITKRFGDFVALDDVDFDLRAGEVHALVGENGAGKSTLMRILAGQLAATEGQFFLEGTATPLRLERSSSRGVGFVEQEGGLVDELTGADNLILAAGEGVLAARRRAAKRIDERASGLGLRARASVPAGQLPVGEKQRLEILVVLAAGARILVLDEPTASLGAEDAAVLARLIRNFTADGGSVVYISHKLREVLAIADRITVLRRGTVTGHYDDTAGLSVAQLAEDMVGIVDSQTRRVLIGDGAVRERGSQNAICVLENVTVLPLTTSRERVEQLRSVSFNVQAGEILGIAGVVGSGQTSLAELLAGQRQPTSGTVTHGPGAIAYIPEHRRDHAIAAAMSVAENTVVHAHRGLGRGPFLSRRVIAEYAARIVETYNVRTPSLTVPIAALSGGNQQRAVVGRELDREPALVVAHNPFRGLDVRAIADVESALIRAAERGAGVVVISSDLEEIMPISSRILVLFDGEIVGEVDPDSPVASQRLGALMGGVA